MYRVATVLRSIARGGLAGLIAGIVVGGLGGRIVMSVVALMNPTATGLLTENGEAVGRFTAEGTLALVVFGGLSTGMLGAVVWVVISPWLPAVGRGRTLVAAFAAVALTSFMLVSGTNSDFLILRPRAVILAMLFLLVALAGLTTAVVDGVLERRLPRAEQHPGRLVAGYGAVAVLGLPAVFFTLLAYFSPTFHSDPRPPGVGLALLVVGTATALTWLLRMRRDEPTVPAVVTWVARAAVVVAIALGGLHIAGEASRILALG
jgi:hypothetical protein